MDLSKVNNTMKKTIVLICFLLFSAKNIYSFSKSVPDVHYYDEEELWGKFPHVRTGSIKQVPRTLQKTIVEKIKSSR